MCLISPISCWHITRLSRHSVRMMDERSSVRIFPDYGCYNTEKSVLYRQRRSNFSRRQCPKRKTDSYVVSGCDNGISRGWERKSMAERLVTGRVWPCTWKMSSVGKDLVKNWEICVLKITPIVWFCNVSTHSFILSLSTNALYDFYSGIVDPYTFIH